VVDPIGSVRDSTEAIVFAGIHNRKALVDVAAEWCAFCKAIDGKILVHPQVEARMTYFALLKIDVTAWTVNNAELLRLLNVQGPPSLFIVETRQGKKFRVHGPSVSLTSIIWRSAGGCAQNLSARHSSLSSADLIKPVIFSIAKYGEKQLFSS
jgi:thiol-disulfide isomerase/thioredoxin